jgi:hypothetical protein
VVVPEQGFPLPWPKSGAAALGVVLAGGHSAVPGAARRCRAGARRSQTTRRWKTTGTLLRPAVFLSLTAGLVPVFLTI